MIPATRQPGDLAIIAPAGSPVRDALTILSAAYRLTDDLARALLQAADLPGDDLIAAIRVCAFVEDVGREWGIAERARRVLLAELRACPARWRLAHGLLGEVADRAQEQAPAPGATLPRYLANGAGLPYHRAALDVADGLGAYARLGRFGAVGGRWLASRLAREQESAGLIPMGSLEVTFLRGVVHLHEGDHDVARELFAQVAQSRPPRIEVAMALHALACLDHLGGRADATEGLLRESLAIGEAIDDRPHRADVLYSLGRVVALDPRRSDEARTLLEASAALLPGRPGSEQHRHVRQALQGLAARGERRPGCAVRLVAPLDVRGLLPGQRSAAVTDDDLEAALAPLQAIDRRDRLVIGLSGLRDLMALGQQLARICSAATRLQDLLERADGARPDTLRPEAARLAEDLATVRTAPALTVATGRVGPGPLRALKEADRHLSLLVADPSLDLSLRLVDALVLVAHGVLDAARQLAEDAAVTADGRWRPEISTALHQVLGPQYRWLGSRSFGAVEALAGRALVALSDAQGADLRDIRLAGPDLGGLRWNGGSAGPATRWPAGSREQIVGASVQIGPDRWEIVPGTTLADPTAPPERARRSLDVA